MHLSTNNICLLLCLIASNMLAQNNLPYKTGEKTLYKISFGLLDVGYGELNIYDGHVENNKTTYHIIGKGWTTKFFDMIFRVRDTYETYINKKTLLPIRFIRDVDEGGYLINQEYMFFHSDSIVKSSLSKNKFNIPGNAQDMLSAFFYARTFEKKEVLKDSLFTIPIFMDEETYFLEVKYLYDEILDTKFGNISCMVFKPRMQKGRIFEKEEEMKIWITNDKNKILLRVETKIWAGTIKAQLENYKNLKYPLLND